MLLTVADFKNVAILLLILFCLIIFRWLFRWGEEDIFYQLSDPILLIWEDVFIDLLR